MGLLLLEKGQKTTQREVEHAGYPTMALRKREGGQRREWIEVRKEWLKTT